MAHQLNAASTIACRRNAAAIAADCADLLDLANLPRAICRRELLVVASSRPNQSIDCFSLRPLATYAIPHASKRRTSAVRGKGYSASPRPAASRNGRSPGRAALALLLQVSKSAEDA